MRNSDSTLDYLVQKPITTTLLQYNVKYLAQELEYIKYSTQRSFYYIILIQRMAFHNILQSGTARVLKT